MTFDCPRGFFHFHYVVEFVKPINLAPSLSVDGPAGNIRGAKHRVTKQRVVGCAQRENFFTNRVADDWSALPAVVINAVSVNSFKNLLDDYFGDAKYVF